MGSIDRSALVAQARALLLSNRVQAQDGRYTRPAERTYPHQWLWDSCFHAIALSLLGENEFAHDELRALFRAQEKSGPDRGRLPHMTLFGRSQNESAQDEAAAKAYANDVALWQSERSSTLTQPPILAETILRVGDASLYRELFVPLCDYYDWWLRRRDPESEGLVSIWHPWESGADATPRADEPMRALVQSGRRPKALDRQTVNPTAKKSQDLLAARFLLLEDLQSVDAAERSGALTIEAAQKQRQAMFGLQAIEMQAFLVRNLLDLSTIGDTLGERAASTRYRGIADVICKAINARLWDESAGYYRDRIGAAKRPVERFTYAPFLTLYAGDLVPRARAERLLAHLCDRNRFWTDWPVPTVARDDAAFDPDEYWRGSTWININWFIVRGLLHSAERFNDDRYLAAAKTIAQKSVALVEKVGLREYYRSHGDEPLGFGPGLGWSTLVIDLARLADEPLRDVTPLP